MSLTADTSTTSNGGVEETDVPSINECSHSRNLAYLINEVYRPRIVEDVDFGVLISYMPFMNTILPQVYSLRRTSPKDAANIFFDYLKNVEEEGKYQSFLDALRQAKYPLLVSALENSEVVSHDHEHNQLISLFFGEIVKTIDAEMMSQELQMKEVITAEEGEQIRKTARHFGNHAASFELLIKIPHRAIDWYDTFLNLLFDHKHHKLLETIDPKFFEKKMLDRNEEANSSMAVEETVNNASDISMPVSAAAHSVRAPAHSVPQRLSAGAAAHSVPPRQTEFPSSEFSDRVLSELTELKALVHTQTQCLQTLLGKTELLFGRVDSLEQKLESLVKTER